MVRHSAHGIVADSCGDGTAHPGWVGEEGVQAAVAAIIEINVDSAVEREYEVAD